MHELAITEFHRAASLFAGLHCLLPGAILEGMNPGRVFVDQPKDPRLAMIWTSSGYYFLAGDPPEIEMLADIRRTLHEVFVAESKRQEERGFILYPYPPTWEPAMQVILQGRQFYPIFRRQFQFSRERFERHTGWRERIPAGMRLSLIDRELLNESGSRYAGEIPPTWASTEAFLAGGLGILILDGEQVASQCTAVYASSRGYEIDIFTAEPYRRRGLGFLAACAFIEASLERGKHPNWECFWDNEASSNLAEKLGYIPQQDYPIYYWVE